MMNKEEMWHSPLSREEIFFRFDKTSGSSLHLLVLYSLVIGLNAKIILELGLGQTTGVLRAAAAQTEATVHTCDENQRRFEHLLEEQDDRWRLYLESSRSFLKKVPEPVDLAMHDGAHDYQTVRRDLEQIIPKMRKFGIICVHDTQQTHLYRHMLAAIQDAVKSFSVSVTNLPYGAGLAIIRVESSPHPPILPRTGTLGEGEPETLLAEFPAQPSGDAIRMSQVRTGLGALHLRARHILRQWGLKS